MSETFSWLNKSFLVKVVKNQFSWNENDFSVESFDVSSASGKGDNYLGTLLRVRVVIVKGEEKLEQYYIIKTSDGDGNSLEGIATLFGVYPKEKEVYGKILPAFEAIWKEVGIDVTFGPKCYGTFDDPVDIIVLEDLKQEGFAIGDRCVGLDLEHVLEAVGKVSQFHAASLIYLEKYGKFDEKYNVGLFSAKIYKGEWKRQYSALVQAFIKAISTWPGFEKIVNKAKLWGSDIYLHGSEAVKVNAGDIGCLIHGDMWINNLLFKETSDGKPEEVRLIDFQITCWSSPVQDLYNLISHSLLEDDRQQEFDTIVANYQESLENNLKLLKYTGHIPSLREIQSEMLKRSMVGICCVIEGMVIILMDKDESLNNELLYADTEEGQQYRCKIFSNPRFVRAAQKYLNFMYKRGMLDLP